MCLRLFRNREDHFVAVFVLVLFDLLLCQRGKIILFKTGNKKCAADNVIRHTVIIGQGAVPRQAQQLALVIADERHRVIEGVNCLNGAAYELLHGRKSVVDLLHFGHFHGAHHKDFHFFCADMGSSFFKRKAAATDSSAVAANGDSYSFLDASVRVFSRAFSNAR